MVTMNGCLTVRPGVAFPVGQTLGQTASFRQTAPETWCQSRVCDAMRIHTDNTTVLICVHLCSSAAICFFSGVGATTACPSCARMHKAEPYATRLPAIDGHGAHLDHGLDGADGGGFSAADGDEEDVVGEQGHVALFGPDTAR